MTRLSARYLRRVMPPTEVERLGLKAERKYGNEPVTEDGYRFDSHGEARRYRLLRALASAGAITEFRVHPSWDLAVNGILVGRYVADFAYVLDGELAVEDFKSKPTRTAVYQLKKRLMKALYGVKVQEVFR